MLQRCIIITPYSTSGYESTSCKGACTDVIRIQAKNDFCCFPSVAFEHGYKIKRLVVTLTIIFVLKYRVREIAPPSDLRQPRVTLPVNE